ncbi:putative armadillo-like helical, importin beta family [Helianthus annuus]|nr:putative armadillo-like helical, importin beta family [Helianthus annuus]
MYITHQIWRYFYLVFKVFTINLFVTNRTQDQKDDIGNLPVAGVKPFVLKNISKHWRSCEAVKYAYGSYPEGLSDEQRYQRVGSDLVYLLQEARGENSGEKDRAVWTLSRLFELLHNPATYNSEISLNLTMLMEVLECYMYKDVCRFPHFRKKVCVAVYHLAKGYGKKKSPVLEPDHYPHIIRCLAAAGRSADPELASAAYKAVNELVKYSNPDGSSQMILPLLKVVWTKLKIGPLKSSVDAEPFALSSVDEEPFTLIGPLKSSVDAEPFALSSVDAEPFALICGCLQDIIQKLSSTSKTKLIVVENEYNIAWCLLKVFAFGSPTVYEKAMLATDAFACAIGIEFRKYMKRFYEYLEMGLKDRVQCSISVKVVGNICRVLDYELLPFCGSIMERLTSLYYEVPLKPLVFSCFGDMALAIGLHFEPYVSCMVHMMETAANEFAHIKNVNDKAMVEYGKRLKRSIFKAYSGILQGCKKSKAEIMVPYAPKLLKFIKVLARDPNRDLSLLKAAVALLRDLAVALGPNAEVIKDWAFCSEFLRECLNSGNKQLKETATQTIKMTVHVLSIYR